MKIVVKGKKEMCSPVVCVYFFYVDLKILLWDTSGWP